MFGFRGTPEARYRSLSMPPGTESKIGAAAVSGARRSLGHQLLGIARRSLGDLTARLIGRRVDNGYRIALLVVPAAWIIGCGFRSFRPVTKV